MGEVMKPCENCATTGFSDKVGRGCFTFEPREKICAECHGRGWVDAPQLLERKET